MTTPIERTLAVIDALEFLEQLASQILPLSTEDIRAQAAMLLRHYPSPWDIRMAADLEDKTQLGIQVFSKEGLPEKCHLQVEP